MLELSRSQARKRNRVQRLKNRLGISYTRRVGRDRRRGSNVKCVCNRVRVKEEKTEVGGKEKRRGCVGGKRGDGMYHRRSGSEKRKKPLSFEVRWREGRRCK